CSCSRWQRPRRLRAERLVGAAAAMAALTRTASSPKSPALTSSRARRSSSMSVMWDGHYDHSAAKIETHSMPDKAPLPEHVEDYRDHHWRREETRRVETVVQAEEFVER